MLPDRSLLNGQKLVKMPELKLQIRYFELQNEANLVKKKSAVEWVNFLDRKIFYRIFINGIDVPTDKFEV